VAFAFPAATRRITGGLISMRDVRFGWKEGAELLFSGLGFDLSMDSRVALVGPNGCGKTTFMSLLTGAVSPTRGEVDQASGWLRVGQYSQHEVDNLPRGVTAVEHLHGLLGEVVQKGSPAYQQVRHELGIKGLPSSAHELKLRDLSGGQKARAVARHALPGPACAPLVPCPACAMPRGAARLRRRASSSRRARCSGRTCSRWTSRPTTWTSSRSTR
jgi:ATP-binding cassette subfamily F protein 1